MAQQTSSDWPFGRQDTGSAIQRLMSDSPASAMDANPDLGRERALGDLAVDGGTGQPGSGKDGLEANDTVRLTHGRAGSY